MALLCHPYALAGYSQRPGRPFSNKWGTPHQNVAAHSAQIGANWRKPAQCRESNILLHLYTCPTSDSGRNVLGYIFTPYKQETACSSARSDISRIAGPSAMI